MQKLNIGKKYKLFSFIAVLILIAITVCVNIAISIVDNEIYMNYSDQFISEKKIEYLKRKNETLK